MNMDEDEGCAAGTPTVSIPRSSALKPHSPSIQSGTRGGRHVHSIALRLCPKRGGVKGSDGPRYGLSSIDLCLRPHRTTRRYPHQS